MIMRKTAVLLLICTLLPHCTVFAAEPPQVDGASAILMEASTGKVLMEMNADTPLPPASVTKVMTLLIIYDSIAAGKIKWDDSVTVSEHAASMGGSQIFLEPMQKQTAEVLTKAIAIASANDAAVAMAEYIAGSEEAFVKMMNERAKQLGMKNASFKNACGLDTDGHVLSARDIAIMSRELMTKYPEITKYTTKWQDTITHTTAKGTKEFGLTNTNRLIKWYDGATGLKTGSTGKALYCLSGTAKRNDMELIAVIMACPDPKERFRQVMKMLDYGYANYEIAKGDVQGAVMASVPVSGGESDNVNAVIAEQVSCLAEKGKAELAKTIKINENVTAPIKKGDIIGEVTYSMNGEAFGTSMLAAENDVPRCGYVKNLKNLFKIWFRG